MHRAVIRVKRLDIGVSDCLEHEIRTSRIKADAPVEWMIPANRGMGQLLLLQLDGPVSLQQTCLEIFRPLLAALQGELSSLQLSLERCNRFLRCLFLGNGGSNYLS
jgi:hypothetical protein